MKRNPVAFAAACPPTHHADDTLCINVFVVVPPRLLLLDIAGPLEVLRQANRVQGNVRFDVFYVGPRAGIRTSIGMALSNIQPLPSSLPDQAWIVLGGDVEEVMLCGGGKGDGKSPEDAVDEMAIVGWLRAAVQPSHILISICTGALLAARAGLLDGYACTTHHVSCEELARLAPRARVLDNRLFVQDGARHSSAGITAGIDLMLHLVSQAAGQGLRRRGRALPRYLCAPQRQRSPVLALAGRPQPRPSPACTACRISSPPT